jgi:hypothetical protein
MEKKLHLRDEPPPLWMAIRHLEESANSFRRAFRYLYFACRNFLDIFVWKSMNCFVRKKNFRA